MTTRLAALALVAVLATCTACSDQRGSTAAPPVVVCGTTLSHAAAGGVLNDASLSRPMTITGVSVGGDIYLKVAANCRTGAHVTVQPVTAATIVTEARASDGQTAALVVQPAASEFAIKVERAGGSRDVIEVRLTDPPSGATHTSS